MTKSLETLLTEARKRIEVMPEELDEARRRRSLIALILMKEFPGSRVYVNGSIAHGDALTPLTDVDLGVVDLDLDDEYGPGNKGPAALQERAARALRAGLREESRASRSWSSGVPARTSQAGRLSTDFRSGVAGNRVLDGPSGSSNNESGGGCHDRVVDGAGARAG